MKSERVFLDDLNSNSRAYKVKVRVIEKGCAKMLSKKGVAYQNLLLEDDKGNRMSGALFGDQIDAYKDAFVYNGVYDIANAPIKSCDPQWKTIVRSNLDYQMSFGSNTVIQPVDSAMGSIEPDYQTIAQIPTVDGGEEIFDVLGVVIYVEENSQKVVTRQQRIDWVREIVIVDHSVEQPITISTWGDLAEDSEKLFRSREKFSVIGLTALKISSYKGVLLKTSMLTTFVHDPDGERASNLRKWAMHHQNALDEMQSRVLDIRKPNFGGAITTIEALHQKKAQNSLQEERHWLRVYVPEPEFDKLNAYLGCSNCGKRSDIAEGQSFNCTRCSRSNCVSSPSITFSCEVTDNTGKLAITAFTADSEKLFRQSAPDLFRLKQTNDQGLFQMMKKRLQTSSFLVQVGPKSTLSHDDILQWVLKKVEVDDKEEDNVVVPEKLPAEASTSEKTKTNAKNEAMEISKPLNEAGKLVGSEIKIKDSPQFLLLH